MLDREKRKMLLRLGMFAMPVLIVKLVSMSIGSAGPQGAEASSTVSSQTNAIEYVTKLPALPDIGEMSRRSLSIHRESPLVASEHIVSPFYHNLRPAMVVTTSDEAPALPPPAREFSIPEFELGAIMRSSGGNTALINGDLWRKGDEVTAGWFIDSIDADRRAVKLDHPETGRSTTVQVQIPR